MLWREEMRGSKLYVMERRNEGGANCMLWREEMRGENYMHRIVYDCRKGCVQRYKSFLVFDRRHLFFD